MDQITKLDFEWNFNFYWSCVFLFKCIFVETNAFRIYSDKLSHHSRPKIYAGIRIMIFALRDSNEMHIRARHTDKSVTIFM